IVLHRQVTDGQLAPDRSLHRPQQSEREVESRRQRRQSRCANVIDRFVDAAAHHARASTVRPAYRSTTSRKPAMSGGGLAASACPSNAIRCFTVSLKSYENGPKPRAATKVAAARNVRGRMARYQVS